jgi:hypothetical protein
MMNADQAAHIRQLGAELAIPAPLIERITLSEFGPTELNHIGTFHRHLKAARPHLIGGYCRVLDALCKMGTFYSHLRRELKEAAAAHHVERGSGIGYLYMTIITVMQAHPRYQAAFEVGFEHYGHIADALEFQESLAMLGLALLIDEVLFARAAQEV